MAATKKSRSRTTGRTSRSKTSGRRYGKKSSEKVRRAMHEMKRGKLRSGRSGKKVTSRRQAVAIGLSEARRAGAKVPKKGSTAGKKRASKKS